MIGLLGTVALVGALLSSAVAGRVVGRLGQARVFVVGTFLIGLAFLAQAFTTPGWGLAWWVVGGFVASFCIIATNVVAATIRQSVCPPELLGRVGATMELVVWGVMPVASLLGGVLGTVAGVRVAVLVSGVIACLAVVWLLTSRMARRSEIVGARR